MSSTAWVTINGYGGLYEISTAAQVRKINRCVNCRTPAYRYLKNHVGQAHGYYYVILTRDGVATKYLLHRLMAIAFKPNPEGLPTVNHIDGNKLNNAIENLEWASYAHNNRHARETGLNRAFGSRAGASRLSEDEVIEIKSLIKNGTSSRLIAKKFSVNPSSISRIKSGAHWKHLCH